MRDSIDFVAHNTGTGADLAPIVEAGPWGHGGSMAAGDGSTAPSGTYFISVKLPHPEANQCRWHVQAQQ